MRSDGRDPRPWPQAVALALTVALLAAPAAAEPPASDLAVTGGDVVYLQTGELARGRIVALEPGVRVELLDADGRVRRFAWSEVASTRIGPDSPMGERDAQLERPDRAHPRLHIDLTWPAALYTYELLDRRSDRVRGRLGLPQQVDRVVYRQGCRAPCDVVIDASDGRVFFFGGDDIPPSREFHLDELGPEVVATVHPGDRTRLIGGIIFTPLGAAAMLLGGLVLGLAPDSSHPAGPLSLGLGSAMLGGGIAMLVTGSTRVRLRAAKRG